MEASVLDVVRAVGAVSPADRLVVLVSGGRDSVFLLDVLTSICGPANLRALHLNYGLRAQESDGDELHVRELCAQLGVPLVCSAAPPPPTASR